MITPGTYYVVVNEDEGLHLPKGALVCVSQVTPEEIHYVSGEQRFVSSREEFLEMAQLDPGGAQKRQAEIQQLMRDIQQMQMDTGALQSQLSFTPSIAQDGELVVDTGLVPMGPWRCRGALAS